MPAPGPFPIEPPGDGFPPAQIFRKSGLDLPSGSPGRCPDRYRQVIRLARQKDRDFPGADRRVMQRIGEQVGQNAAEQGGVALDGGQLLGALQMQILFAR